MKMAKLQKATLDPTKISGRCGRLKCCLRYEYDTYEELQRELPPVGSDIVTKNGRAACSPRKFSSQQLLVATEDNRRILIPASDVLTVIKAGSGRRAETGRQTETREGPEDGETEGQKRRRKNRDENARRDRSGSKSIPGTVDLAASRAMREVRLSTDAGTTPRRNLAPNSG